MRTRLLGDFTFGPQCGRTTDIAFEVTSKTHLLHNACFWPDQPIVSVVAVHPKSPSVTGFAPPGPRNIPNRHNPVSCYSSAYLTSVACIWIYREAETGFLAGFIIDYENGAQRALGSCRVGVDVPETCRDLNRVCVTPVEIAVDLNIQVEVRDTSEPLEAGWARFQEDCFVEMWFHMEWTQKTTRMTIHIDR